MSGPFTHEQEKRIREIAGVVPLHLRPRSEPMSPTSDVNRIVRLTRWAAILCTLSAACQVVALALRMLGYA